MATSSSPSIRLFRSLLRASYKIQDYNIRSYALRRARLGFEKNRGLIEVEGLKRELEEGKRQLEMLKRQSQISRLYPEGQHSVMEHLKTGS